MKADLKIYLDYIEAHEPGESSTLLFTEAVNLFESSTSSNVICPKREKRDSLIKLLDLLKDEFRTYSAALIAAVLSQSVSNLSELKLLKNKFPASVLNIVEAFFQIRKLKFGEIKTQPEEARSLILSVAQDMRAVLLDFAIQIIRVRNIEDLDQMRLKPLVFDLVEYIYIPIAHRLGFYQIKSELEDYVLQFRNPDVYRSIEHKLLEGHHDRHKLVSDFIQPIREELESHKIKYEVKSRTKSISSIWSKMQKQGVPFEKVYDLWAVRFLIDSKPKEEKANCWHVYSVITNIYTPNSSRLRDWITFPKETGYESLHITVQIAKKNWVEVQIRTLRMDDEAENGMTAHWRYKGGKANRGIDFWLQNIRQEIEKKGGQNSQGFFLPSNKFNNEVYVFTPTGHVKKLRLGSTVLDFAFAIHTDIGSTFASATVNGKIVPIDHMLKNGDQVRIQTSKNNRPTLDWLNIVVDPRTKSKIKHVLDEKRQQKVNLGKELLSRRAKNWKIDLKQGTIDRLAKHYKLKKTSDLFYNIAMESIDILAIKKLLTEEQTAVPSTPQLSTDEDNINFENDQEVDDVLVIDKLDNINFSLAKCCHPIPGDPIFGFVTVSKGISIHRNKCPNAAELRERYPYRIIESIWKSQNQTNNFHIKLFLEGEHKDNIVSKITHLVSSDLKIKITNMKYKPQGSKFSAAISLKIHDAAVLDNLKQELLKLKGVEHVYR